jgi:hypothetical protein
MPKEEEKIETFDEVRGVGILSGRPPSPVAYGPMRRAPEYYAGEKIGRQVIQHKDAERYGNGALPGKRNKAARRVIRGALKRRFSKPERAMGLPRAMQAQGLEIARENGKSDRWAKRLYAKELAIHQPVYAPDKKTLRKMRTEARAAKRKGKLDAIGQLVDAMAKK